MSFLIDQFETIPSPALVPATDVPRGTGSARSELTIALLNNMPDSALKAAERQFIGLVQDAAGDRVRIRFHLFSLPSIRRSHPASFHVERQYTEFGELRRMRLDGLIVTGAEPVASSLRAEPFWNELAEIIDWARTGVRSTIWSCLAAHAAVLHLDGIERRRLDAKCSGIYECRKVTDDPLLRGTPASLRISHSRLNEIAERDLADRGYRILTRSSEAGIDIFTRNVGSEFIFFQGHPEYDAHTLQREYMRDVGRFLSGQRDDYPRLPHAYFDERTEEVLRGFERRARANPDPTLAAELPGLHLRDDIAAGVAAAALFRNWLERLAAPASAEARLA